MRVERTEWYSKAKEFSCSHQKQEYQKMIGKKSIIEKEKQVLRDLANNKCEQCGEEETYLEIHRIVREVEGGTYKPSNIKCLCPNCHKLFHTNEPNMGSK